MRFWHEWDILFAQEWNLWSKFVRFPKSVCIPFFFHSTFYLGDNNQRLRFCLQDRTLSERINPAAPLFPRGGRLYSKCWTEVRSPISWSITEVPLTTFHNSVQFRMTFSISASGSMDEKGFVHFSCTLAGQKCPAAASERKVVQCQAKLKKPERRQQRKKGQWHQRHQQWRTKIQQYPKVCLEHSLRGNCSLWTRVSCWNWAIVVIIAVVVVVFSFFVFVDYNDNALQCSENWKVVKCRVVEAAAVETELQSFGKQQRCHFLSIVTHVICRMKGFKCLHFHTEAF